jgi:hypothetical protein
MLTMMRSRWSLNKLKWMEVIIVGYSSGPSTTMPELGTWMSHLNSSGGCG